MLRLGDTVQGKLIEAIDQEHWIVSFDGHLLQVVNKSPMSFEKNKRVLLRVKKESPLELQIESQRKTNKSLNLKV